MATGRLSPSAPNGIRVRRLEAGYGDLRVLHGISVNLPGAGASVLVGPGRSGKTTLVRALAQQGSNDGFWQQGEVDLPESSCRFQWQLPTGQVPSLAQVLAPAGTPDDDLTPAARQALDSVWQPSCEINDRLASMLETPEANLRPWCFRLASFTRALADTARFYVFDEPDADLPSDMTELIAQRLLDLKRQAAVLLVTHNLTLARQVADHAVLMVDGRIVEEGESLGFFQSPTHPRTRDFLHWGS